jgi:hypothetical protein
MLASTIQFSSNERTHHTERPTTPHPPKESYGLAVSTTVMTRTFHETPGPRSEDHSAVRRPRRSPKTT